MRTFKDVLSEAMTRWEGGVVVKSFEEKPQKVTLPTHVWEHGRMTDRHLGVAKVFVDMVNAKFEFYDGIRQVGKSDITTIHPKWLNGNIKDIAHESDFDPQEWDYYRQDHSMHGFADHYGLYSLEKRRGSRLLEELDTTLIGLAIRSSSLPAFYIVASLRPTAKKVMDVGSPLGEKERKWLIRNYFIPRDREFRASYNWAVRCRDREHMMMIARLMNPNLSAN